jgi:hypothetical protein
MTIRQLFVQSSDYSALDDRVWVAALLPVGDADPLGSQVGVRSGTDLVLTMTGPNAGTVSRGAAFISWAGSVYTLTNDGNEPVTFQPAHPTLPRIDLVVARVYDAEAGGADQPPAIYAIPGDPNNNPVVPAVPAGAIPLQQVRYNANSNAPVITDVRTGPITERQIINGQNSGNIPNRAWFNQALPQSRHGNWTVTTGASHVSSGSQAGPGNRLVAARAGIFTLATITAYQDPQTNQSGGEIFFEGDVSYPLASGAAAMAGPIGGGAMFATGGGGCVIPMSGLHIALRAGDRLSARIFGGAPVGGSTQYISSTMVQYQPLP